MLEDGLSWSNELKQSWRFKSSSYLLFFGKLKPLQKVAGEWKNLALGEKEQEVHCVLTKERIKGYVILSWSSQDWFLPTLSGRLLDTLAVLWDVKGFHPIGDLPFFSLSHVCDIKDITPFSKTLKQASVLVYYTAFLALSRNTPPHKRCVTTLKTAV